MDVHTILRIKAVVELLRQQLNASNIVAGDSDNDLSMFKLADEAYAPSNAKLYQRRRHSVIGHHDEDGIARFLRAISL